MSGEGIEVPRYAVGRGPATGAERRIRAVRGALSSLDDRIDGLRFRAWRARHPDARVRNPIFVVGSPRSGTSLAINLLGRHRDVAAWSEAGRIWDPTTYDDPDADHAWGRGERPDERARIAARFEYYRVRRRAPRFANKHPRSSVRLAWIDRAFPDAVVIHIVRDGRAVARSIVRRIEREPHRASMPFGGFCKPPAWRDLLRPDDPWEQAALQWREIVRAIGQARPLFGERWLDVRYEDLCADPRAALARMQQVAGLRPDAALIERLPGHLPDGNAALRDLGSRELRTLERVLGPSLERNGYTRDPAGSGTPATDD